MNLDQLIAVAGIVVASATAFLVAYWHRKQLRQIELYRRDASGNLLPSQSPPAAFFKRYAGLIFGVVWPMLSLAWLITMNSPATAGSVALISFLFALILINLYLRSELRVLNHFLNLITINENVLRILEARRSETEAVAVRLAELEKVVKDGSS